MYGGERRGVYRVLVGKPEEERLLGRPMHRCEDKINPLPANMENMVHSKYCNVSKGQMGFNLGFKGLRWIFKKWDVGVWNGLIWLRIGTGGRHLWMW